MKGLLLSSLGQLELRVAEEFFDNVDFRITNPTHVRAQQRRIKFSYKAGFSKYNDLHNNFETHVVWAISRVFPLSPKSHGVFSWLAFNLFELFGLNRNTFAVRMGGNVGGQNRSKNEKTLPLMPTTIPKSQSNIWALRKVGAIGAFRGNNLSCQQSFMSTAFHVNRISCQFFGCWHDFWPQRNRSDQTQHSFKRRKSNKVSVSFLSRWRYGPL